MVTQALLPVAVMIGMPQICNHNGSAVDVYAGLQAGLDASGEAWWDGVVLDSSMATGAVEVVQ